MVPPWEKYPAIPLGSLGWRMGHGEEYWYEFQDWFAGLEDFERAKFVRTWPERWEGFYGQTVEHARSRKA